MDLREAIEYRYDFKEYMVNFLSEKGELKFGYNDDYYWEEWTVNLNSAKTLMVVEFSIGSASGWIEENDHVTSMSFEKFRELLNNKKFENEEINLVDLIEEATEKMK